MPDRPMYRDRDGNPITMTEWTDLLASGDDYRVVGQESIDDETRVSTVWLGLDHNFMPGAPIAIFETLVFGGPHDQWMDRYPTKEAALAGHDRIVAALKSGSDLPE